MLHGEAPRPGLDDLAVFVAVADAASFTAAAQRLGLPKSSVSRAVARLEAAQGCALFNRSTRRVGLTAAGRELHRRAGAHVLALRDALREKPERAGQPSGVLRLTAPNDLGAALVAEACARLLARYPALRVECSLTNRLVDLVADGYDVALRVGAAVKPSSLVVRVLGPTVACAYAAPAYLRRAGLPRSWSDVRVGDRVVFLPAGLRESGSLSDELSTARGSIVADDFAFVLSAVRAGAGVGVLPALLGDPEVALGGLARVLPNYAPPLGTARLVFPPGRVLPARSVAFRDEMLALWRERTRRVSPPTTRGAAS